MDWMNYKNLKSPVLCVMLSLFTVLATAQTPHFNQLKNKFDNGQVFKAHFNQTFIDSYTGEITQSEGEIWLDRVRYKLQSEGQIVVVDGETSKVYDPSRNRIIIDSYNPEDDDFAPSRMLSGIDSTYNISEINKAKSTTITLLSRDDFAVFTRVEIVIDAQARPVKITAWDISENEITTTFKNGSFLKPIEKLFTISHPDDAEVIDMRY